MPSCTTTPALSCCWSRPCAGRAPEPAPTRRRPALRAVRGRRAQRRRPRGAATLGRRRRRCATGPRRRPRPRARPRLRGQPWPAGRRQRLGSAGAAAHQRRARPLRRPRRRRAAAAPRRGRCRARSAAGWTPPSCPAWGAWPSCERRPGRPGRVGRAARSRCASARARHRGSAVRPAAPAPANTGASATPVCDPAATTASGVPGDDDAAAAGAAFRAQVDHPVGLGDHVQVVLDDDDAVAAVDQPVQHADQLLHVGHVQPDRRLVQHVQRARRALAAARDVVAHLAQLGDELDALRLAARQRRARLAQRQVAQADVGQQLQRVARSPACWRRSPPLRRPPCCSTSPMLLPRQLTASVSGLKRAPWQMSQATLTSGRKLISMVFMPWPSQPGQRPSPVLNEKRAGA